MLISTKVKLLFGTDDKRNKMLRKNILFSAFIKVVGLSTSMLIVPITLHYLESEQYGIWMTISSVLYWFSFFDVGLGNGMRNYLTQAISLNDYQKARSYLATTFFFLTCISILIAVVATVIMVFLDFNKVFNTYSLEGTELRDIMFIAIAFTLITFVVKNVGLIFVAQQKYAINDLLSMSGNVIALIIIYMLTRTTKGNLLYVTAAFTVVTPVIYLLATIPIFSKQPKLRPSAKDIDFHLGKDIVNKGLGFFFIQITSCLVVFGSSNLIITHYYGPESVTTYNIAYKYFHLISIAYIIVISPIWNAYTDAQVKGDWKWIEKTFNKSLLIWGITLLGGIVMLAMCNIFYRMWVGKDVIIPFTVSICVFFFINMFNLNNCVTYLLNGLNKIRVQIFTSVIFTFVYLSTILVAGSKFQIEEVVLCMSLCYASMAAIHLYQCRLLISQKAKGIWNK
ncbi:MAG: MATE family efflux transporter [Prevotella sp.]|nr:MATE family efflux transporter [Prevotella sp.]